MVNEKNDKEEHFYQMSLPIQKVQQQQSSPPYAQLLFMVLAILLFQNVVNYLLEKERLIIKRYNSNVANG